MSDFRCRHCNEVKPAADFRGDSRMKHRIDYECRACRRKRRLEGVNSLQERVNKYQRRNGEDLITLTAADLAEILSQPACTYCGDPLTYENRTADHVYHLGGYGGVNHKVNLVAACRSCNSSKQQLHVADFYARNARFTPERWTAFTRMFIERLMGCQLNDIQVEQAKENFFEEAAWLRRIAQREERAAK